MVDFINEVEEELRKDQYNVLLRKWGPYLAGLAISIVAAAGLYEFMKTSKDRAARNASISYIAATDALTAGDSEGALSQFKAMASQAKPGYAGLALTQAAAIELEAGRAQDAAASFDKAALSFDTDLHKQLAQLKAAYILSGAGHHDDVLARVEPLAMSGAPFAYLARELRGFTHLAMENARSARSDFLYLSSSPGAPEGVRQRAEQMLALTPSLTATPSEPEIAPKLTPEIETETAPKTPTEDKQ
ncbi:MAG: tetratricopeptide repeat protein [Robiginitomaculum sp.]